jgi:hypothetical protein
MTDNPFYHPIKQALEKKAQEEITKLLSSMSQNHLSKSLKVNVSIEGVNNDSQCTYYFSSPKLENNSTHISFQNCLSEDTARMLQHAC